MNAGVFYHAGAQMNLAGTQQLVLNQDALGTLVSYLDYRKIAYLQFKTDSFHEIFANFANTVSVQVIFAGSVIINDLLFDLADLAEIGPRG
jgi:hypothetical protein